jgi:hypothetical protein
MYTAIEFNDATDRELQMAAKFADAGECPKLQVMVERPDLRERDREALREYLVDRGYKALLIETARLTSSSRNVAFSTALPLTHSADVSNRGKTFLSDLGFFRVTPMMSFGAPSLKYTVSHSFEGTIEILHTRHDVWDFELADIKPNIVCRDGRYDDYIYSVRASGTVIGRLTVRRFTDERSVTHIELHPLN